MFPPLATFFPLLAEDQSYQRLGRRLYSRLTTYRQTTPHGLSARVPRDSPEERNRSATNDATHILYCHPFFNAFR